MKQGLPLLGVGCCLIAGAYWWAHLPAPIKNPAKTSQELVHKLALAVQKGDEREIAALFTTNAGYQSFLDVRVDSVTATASHTPLSRSDGESGLITLQRWFTKHGTTPLHCNNLGCDIEGHDLSLGIEDTEEGYLFGGASYPL